MIKHGKVVVGETPSTVSGEVSDQIKDDEPVVDDEKPVDPGLKKLASALTESDSKHADKL